MSASVGCAQAVRRVVGAVATASGLALGWLPLWAQASACGGTDHLVQVRPETTAQLKEALGQVALASQPATLSLSNSPGGEAIQVTHARFTPAQLSFRTEQGWARFALPSKAVVRESDITSLTRPEQQGLTPRANPAAYRENEAVIFRELTWHGLLHAPAGLDLGTPVRRQGSRQTVRASLTLQGTGNACLQASDFRKWVLWVGEHRVAGLVKQRP